MKITVAGNKKEYEDGNLPDSIKNSIFRKYKM